jgi:Fe-S-cluster containining protein
VGTPRERAGAGRSDAFASHAPPGAALTDAAVNATVGAAEERGKPISCRKGCGACCRQLVPVSEAEARHLGQLVDQAPPPRRALLRERFDEARRRLIETGLLNRLRRAESWTDDVFMALANDYFKQSIACPFLEDESCSIYEDRPLKCREFMVTTPAENCAHPTPETVHSLPMPVRFSAALARFDVPRHSACYERWVPLVLAPEWAASHGNEPGARPGPEILRELFDHLKAGDSGAAPVTL